EMEQVVGEVGRVARLAPIVEHARGGRAVAVEAGVGIGVAEVEVGSLVLPADLAESLPETRRGEITPSGFIEVVPAQEIVEVAALTAGHSFEGAPPEAPAVRLAPGPRVLAPALGPHRERSAESLQSECAAG